MVIGVSANSSIPPASGGIEDPDETSIFTAMNKAGLAA